MSIVNDNYTIPASWDDFRSDYINNGDTADWVYMILGAMLERVTVCIGGNWGGSAMQSAAGDYFGRYGNFRKYGRGYVELYDFAKDTEVLLDKMLTPNREYGTVNNVFNPDGQSGYFVVPDPSRFMHRVDYKDSNGVNSTVVVPTYLTIRDVISISGMNYKTALNNVARGDTIDKFVPFFTAVKNVLNYLTCVPCKVWYVAPQAVGYAPGNTEPAAHTDTAVHQKLTELYNNVMQNQPEMWMIANGNNFSKNNYTRIHKYDQQSDRYNGSYQWNNIWVQGIGNKWPNWNIDLYMGTWAEDINIVTYDVLEYAWMYSKYTFAVEKLGTTSGPAHWLKTDGSFTSKIPAGGLVFPSTPSRGQYNVAGYHLHFYFFADFANGFIFMDNGN